MPLLYTPDLLFEGFSLSRAVLLDSEGNEQPDGEIYGARSAVWEPEIESYDEFSHEKLINVWSDVRRVNFTMEAGYTSLGVWVAMTGSSLEQSGLPGSENYSASVLLYDSANAAPLPVKVIFPARTATGVACDVSVTLFRVKFKPPRVSGASYKDGQSVTYEGTVIKSATDETGSVLDREAFGRLDVDYQWQAEYGVFEDTHSYDDSLAVFDDSLYTFDGDVHKTIYR